ncbi:MAG: DNA repair protein RadC [Lachnospiraceae bacterium]|nr:DNA repair protein RadC [Lachnospiraceae bacterium]
MKPYLTVKELPKSERPYEKALEKGAEYLSDAELLAVIIRTGGRNMRSIDLAHQILNHQSEYPGLLGLFYTTKEDLMKIKGVGSVKAVQLLAIAELAKRLTKSQRRERLSFHSPSSIAEYYMESLRHEKREKTVLILLDGKCHVIREMILSEGTVNTSMASPREIFQEALKYEAVYVILLHNHPSGDPTPSNKDLDITKVIRDAGELIGIPLIDHIIIGDCKYVSLREQKLL